MRATSPVAPSARSEPAPDRPGVRGPLQHDRGLVLEDRRHGGLRGHQLPVGERGARRLHLLEAVGEPALVHVGGAVDDVHEQPLGRVQAVIGAGEDVGRVVAGLVRPSPQERPVGQRGPGGDRPDRAVPSSRVARRGGRGRPRCRGRRDRLPAVPDHPGRRRHPSRPPSRAGRRSAGRDGGARAPRPGRTPPPARRPPRDRRRRTKSRVAPSRASVSAPARRGTGASCPLVAGCPRSGRVGGLEGGRRQVGEGAERAELGRVLRRGAAQRHRGRLPHAAVQGRQHQAQHPGRRPQSPERAPTRPGAAARGRR